MPLPNYDVVLGMDWLSKNHVLIDCRQGCVFLNPPGGPELKVIGASEGMECVTYTSIPEEAGPPHPLIAEFLDVFPDNLPGLSPDRDVKFSIDLVPGAAPISQRCYRVNPKESKEMKDQIDKLLAQGFIRTDASPWGSASLICAQKGWDSPDVHRLPGVEQHHH